MASQPAEAAAPTRPLRRDPGAGMVAGVCAGIAAQLGVDVDYQDARRARLGAPRLIIDANIGIGALRIEPVQHGRLAGNHACANA